VFFQRLTKYGSQANSHDWLKAIAILLMVVDHTGVYFFPDDYLFRFIGRFSFPIFFFLIGYTYQGLRFDSPADINRKWARYYIKLPLAIKKLLEFFWAFNIKSDLLVCLLLITVSDIVLNGDLFPLNILFSVIVCRIVLYAFDRYAVLSNGLIVSWLVLTLIHFPLTLLYEYGGAAILVSMVGYLTRRERRRELIPLTFIFLSYLTYCASQMLYFPATFNYILPLYIGIAVLFIFLADYKFKKTYWLPGVALVNYPIMFISRYSLYVYTVHLLAFKVISKMLY
jgi:hypothetical protein